MMVLYVTASDNPKDNTVMDLDCTEVSHWMVKYLMYWIQTEDAEAQQDVVHQMIQSVKTAIISTWLQ